MRRDPFTVLCGLALLGASALSMPALAQDTCPKNLTWEALMYGLEWAYLAFDPSEANPSGLVPAPSGGQLATWPRNTASEKRIVLFGDLLPMQKDTPPRVHSELRALFASADLVIGNVESSVTKIESVWSQHPLDLEADQSGEFHASTGFLKSVMAQYCMNPAETVLNVANNHAGDHGRAGWEETWRAMATLGLRGVVGKRDGEDGPLVGSYELGHGLTIGVAGWTEVENCPLDGAWARYADVHKVDWSALKQQRGIELLVGSVHWGEQFHFFPEQATRTEARELIARGFGLIAAHGPTIPQPAERFSGGMALYSLGSLNQNYSLNGSTHLVPVAEVVVDAQGRIVEYRVHPFATRKVDTSLPGLIYCPDGRIVSDLPRGTSWEIVPLREISNFWGARERLEQDFALVFPH